MLALIAALAFPRPLVMAHYMPWYTAKPYSKEWGWHWTMNHFNPDRGQIASHYRPVIGAYDSSDPDVLEYHTLLMKVAGIDGAIIDWYGKEDVYDYALNHRNTLEFIDAATKAGLKFAICYEDQTVPNLVKFGKVKTGAETQHARELLSWLDSTWFSAPNYLRIKREPLMLVFGPQHFKGDEWPQIKAGRNVRLFGVMGPHRFGNGGFGWPTPKEGTAALESFYARAKGKEFIAVAYPRFHDIYAEAKVHDSWGRVDDRDGLTFKETFDLALKSGSPVIQIATWNDWGEGTIVEPSEEFGYRDLERIQAWRRQQDPAFMYRADDLQLPLRLYGLRKSRPASKADLNEAAGQLRQGKANTAAEILQKLESKR